MCSCSSMEAQRALSIIKKKKWETILNILVTWILCNIGTNENKSCSHVLPVKRLETLD